MIHPVEIELTEFQTLEKIFRLNDYETRKSVEKAGAGIIKGARFDEATENKNGSLHWKGLEADLVRGENPGSVVWHCDYYREPGIIGLYAPPGYDMQNQPETVVCDLEDGIQAIGNHLESLQRSFGEDETGLLKWHAYQIAGTVERKLREGYKPDYDDMPYLMQVVKNFSDGFGNEPIDSNLFHEKLLIFAGRLECFNNQPGIEAFTRNVINETQGVYRHKPEPETMLLLPTDRLHGRLDNDEAKASVPIYRFNSIRGR